MARLGFSTTALGGASTISAIVEAAWDRGVRFFHSAPPVEAWLGRALADRPRSQLVLSTTIAPTDLRAGGVRGALGASVERLGFDGADIVFLEAGDDGGAALEHAFAALANARDQGIVGSIGAASASNDVLCRFVREAPLDCVLVDGRLTLLDQSALHDLHPLCQSRKVDMIASHVIDSGALARAKRLAEVCGRYGVPVMAAALQYPGRASRVKTVLTEARSPEEMRSHAALFEAHIPDDLWQELVAESLLVSA